MQHKPIQDTIQFTVTAETTVTNTTVKITATISSIVTPEIAEANLKEKVQGMLDRIHSKRQMAVLGYDSQ